MVDGYTRIAGLIGDPVAHSLSPPIHNAAYRAAGLNYLYLPFRVRRGHLPAAIRAVLSLEMVGVNVTSPYKEAVLPYLDELSAEAKLLGAVNTVAPVNGGLKGFNTDVEGFLYLLESAALLPLKGETAVLLGAGGAARAVALALQKAGIARLVIVNRSVERAQALRRTLSPAAPFKGVEIAVDQPGRPTFSGKRIAGASLLINCTSVDPVESGILPAQKAIRNLKAIIDLRYSPPEPPFLQWAAAAGVTAINGLNMLLGQGRRSFEIMTGQEAPLEVMKEALAGGGE